jgi:hypothetical protein
MTVYTGEPDPGTVLYGEMDAAVEYKEGSADVLWCLASSLISRMVPVEAAFDCRPED